MGARQRFRASLLLTASGCAPGRGAEKTPKLTGVGILFRATPSRYKRRALQDCPSLMPRPHATLAAMSTKSTRTLCASAPAGSIPELAPVSRPCPTAEGAHINPQQCCPTKGRSGRPSLNGVFRTRHSREAVTVTQRRFSDRHPQPAVTVTQRRFSDRPRMELRSAPPHSVSSGPPDEVHHSNSKQHNRL